MWRTHDGMGWLMLMSGLLWIAFVVVMVLLVAGFVRKRGPVPITPPEPLELARRRYAAGEITREQFLALCADLTAPPADQRHRASAGDHARH